jgi:hypothetical protein
MKKRHIPRGYQALVLGYQHPNGYDWPHFVPLVSAPTRKEARRKLRAHLAKSLTPFTIRLLWSLGKKLRGRRRRNRQGWPDSSLRKKIARLERRARAGY